MTKRDGMGREVGGGSGWGTHVNPCLIHVNVWQKPLQYCKVISLQLIKINEKKKWKIQELTTSGEWEREWMQRKAEQWQMRWGGHKGQVPWCTCGAHGKCASFPGEAEQFPLATLIPGARMGCWWWGWAT